LVSCPVSYLLLKSFLINCGYDIKVNHVKQLLLFAVTDMTILGYA
jgi:hypothetical protein